MSNLSNVNMVNAVESLKDYWETYDQQAWYESYKVETLIDDALYALGIAIDEKQFRFVDGFERFKEILRKHLEPEQ